MTQHTIMARRDDCLICPLQDHHRASLATLLRRYSLFRNFDLNRTPVL